VDILQIYYEYPGLMTSRRRRKRKNNMVKVHMSA